MQLRNLKNSKGLDNPHLMIVLKKIEQILENPYHYKPLRGDHHGSRRVHIGSFVLVYEVREYDKTVLILDYEHHDKVY
jgi:addiction module RelE/StbE family toxin